MRSAEILVKSKDLLLCAGKLWWGLQPSAPPRSYKPWTPRDGEVKPHQHFGVTFLLSCAAGVTPGEGLKGFGEVLTQFGEPRAEWRCSESPFPAL